VRRRTATYPRALRVNRVLRQVVADELERLADADERMRMLTVTAVDTAPDLRTAVVYVATLDPDASDALEERRSHLQRLIGAQTSMKRTPRLTFRADPAIASGSRVEELLRGLHDRGFDDGARRGSDGDGAESEGGGELGDER
jgi:ribosome-binding factor A